MSALKTNSVQIGQSASATNNFTIYQPIIPDGTVRIGNGNIGAATDKVTIDSSGNLTATGSVNATTGISAVGFTAKAVGAEGGQISLNDTTNTYAAYTLDVDTSNHGRLFTTTNNTNLQIGQLTGTGGNIQFYTGGAEHMRIESTGNVLITSGAQTTSVTATQAAGVITLDCNASNVFQTTLTASLTSITYSNPHDGQTINWFITQGGTGSYTAAWSSVTAVKWPGGTAGVLSTAVGAVDLVVLTYRSATGFWYGSLSKAFA